MGVTDDSLIPYFYFHLLVIYGLWVLIPFTPFEAEFLTTTNVALLKLCPTFGEGKANIVVDALSRKSLHMSVLMAIKLDLIEQFIDLSLACERKPKARLALVDHLLSINQSEDKDFKFDKNGILKIRNRVYVPDVPKLKKTILEESHRSSLSILPGATKMYQDLKKMKPKIEHQKLYGLMQLLDIPEWKWDSISINFVIRLSNTPRGFNAIWVIVDRPTKWVYFILIKISYSLQKLAKIYIDVIVKFHGISSIITDGQTDGTIPPIEDLLRACVLEQGGAWDSFLPLIKFTYNNNYNSSIGMAPSKALYGRRCMTPLCWYELGESDVLGPEIVQ
ncbi:uncharacterized protein LOC127103958 [Lathyrus oleraceus]|uniref:uncharacterized protein LOC127103958 n=1 Tax=Pisum sativum TaxID=3888 RepID=UPI0021D2C1DC|nr:uncharacterized protein LOC127103958 [Pisum sativum]